MELSAKKILLTTDGSEDAELAARAATDLAKGTGAKLYVAHAWNPIHPGYPSIAGGEYYYLYEREARRVLEGVVDGIEELDGIEAEPRLLKGAPIDAILGLAEEVEPDLVVLGGRGLGTVGRILLGSVSEGVVHHARFPVLVARGAWPPRKIIVGDDGSETAEGAGNLAASIGALFGAGVVLVRAFRRPPEPIGGWSADDRRRLDEARSRDEEDLAKRAKKLQQKASENGIETRVVEGDAAALLEVAGDGQGALLAVGSRGLGVLGRARFGSFSSKILRAAKGPVLVYPHPGQGRGRTGEEPAAPVGRRPELIS